MRTAIVLRAVMVMLVMVAFDIGIKGKLSFGKLFGCRVCTAGNAAEHLNACAFERGDCAAADAAANQRLHTQIFQETCQRTMSAAVGAHHFRMDNAAVLDGIELKLFGMAEMLKYLTIFIGRCDFHKNHLILYKDSRKKLRYVSYYTLATALSMRRMTDKYFLQSAEKPCMLCLCDTNLRRHYAIFYIFS